MIREARGAAGWALLCGQPWPPGGRWVMQPVESSPVHLPAAGSACHAAAGLPWLAWVWHAAGRRAAEAVQRDHRSTALKCAVRDASRRRCARRSVGAALPAWRRARAACPGQGARGQRGPERVSGWQLPSGQLLARRRAPARPPPHSASIMRPGASGRPLSSHLAPLRLPLTEPSPVEHVNQPQPLGTPPQVAPRKPAPAAPCRTSRTPMLSAAA